MTISHAEFDRLATILGGLAMGSGVTLDEKQALSIAARALFFVATRRQLEFDAFLAELDSPLSAAQIASLKDLGLSE